MKIYEILFCISSLYLLLHTIFILILMIKSRNEDMKGKPTRNKNGNNGRYIK